MYAAQKFSDFPEDKCRETPALSFKHLALHLITKIPLTNSAHASLCLHYSCDGLYQVSSAPFSATGC